MRQAYLGATELNKQYLGATQINKIETYKSQVPNTIASSSFVDFMVAPYVNNQLIDLYGINNLIYGKLNFLYPESETVLYLNYI